MQAYRIAKTQALEQDVAAIKSLLIKKGIVLASDIENEKVKKLD